ncbi:MAG: hypothetical protein AAF960_04690, partial [Bacteroidota bacterium]
MKKSFIVITTINQPTEAVIKYSKLEKYKLIVVGDKKTATNWGCNNTTFLAANYHKYINKELDEALPFNHYSRKMLGYIYAIKNNADEIIDTDDDNIPKENWGFPNLEGRFDTINDIDGFINIYNLYTDKKIWPRGYPLNLVNKKQNISKNIKLERSKIGIWQGLADEDPDVDAVYRLICDEPCYFKERSPIVLAAKVLSPINTQNTLTVKELFPLLYLPSYVTFRFTDILRGLIAQPIMWLYDFQLGFTNATV